MSQPTENDRYFVSSSTSPCSIREMSIIFPCHWRAKNVQPRIFHRGHSMLEASVVLEEISTMGRVSHLSLSFSFPLLHLWINNPNPSQQSLLSMAAKMLENAPSSAFWVRISIRRPLEGRGSGPEQRQLSLSLCLCRSRRPANLNVGQLCTGLCSSTNARFPKRGLGRCSPNKKGHRVRPLANEVEVVKGGRGQLSTDNSWTMKVWDLGWESD